MYEINAKEISASIGTVWNIISDVDNEPLYWQNLTVSNARKDGKAIEREVTVGFRDLKVYSFCCFYRLCKSKKRKRSRDEIK